MLGSLGILTDVHVRDEESPARPVFLDRLGPPFSAVFRPQEALTLQVLTAAVRSLDAARPDAVVVNGDLIDNAQANEMAGAKRALDGGLVDPDSGAPGYDGVQRASDPDPAYYRPDVDPPRHPGLLARAERPFRSPGLRAPWYPVAGNHDLLVAGELARTPRDERRRDRRPRARQARPVAARRPHASATWTRRTIDDLLAQRPARRDRARRARPGPPRAHARAGRRRAAPGDDGAARLHVRPRPARPRHRARHRPARRRAPTASSRRARSPSCATSCGGRATAGCSCSPTSRSAASPRARPLQALLDADPRVLAAIAGDTHHNRITPRPTAAGGYWQITTSALADFPQQARMLRVRETAGGGAVLETWMLDTAPDPLADTARALAFLDAQGGRPDHDAGTRLDRNVRLYRAAPRR